LMRPDRCRPGRPAPSFAAAITRAPSCTRRSHDVVFVTLLAHHGVGHGFSGRHEDDVAWTRRCWTRRRL
jgi:hypothetical protein